MRVTLSINSATHNHLRVSVNVGDNLRVLGCLRSGDGRVALDFDILRHDMSNKHIILFVKAQLHEVREMTSSRPKTRFGILKRGET